MFSFPYPTYFFRSFGISYTLIRQKYPQPHQWYNYDVQKIIDNFLKILSQQVDMPEVISID